jgi:hypothetical protein
MLAMCATFLRLGLVASLSLLPACAVGPAHSRQPTAPRKPTFTATTAPGAPAPAEPRGALAQNTAGEDRITTLPVGIGFTSGPSSFLMGAALDLPLDQDLTIGPALQYGISDSRDILNAFGQVKYWLPGLDLGDDGGRPELAPYIQGGAGVVFLDPENSSSDTELLLNVGAGVRYLTGEKYRIGSTALFNFVPGEVVDEKFFFSWQVIEVVFDF